MVNGEIENNYYYIVVKKQVVYNDVYQNLNHTFYVWLEELQDIPDRTDINLFSLFELM